MLDKKIGETPLEALERFRADQVTAGRLEFANIPMAYAGRLDPMAEGKLLILVGEECKEKEKYLALDKEYEVEIVFGIETDTYDALGMAKIANLEGEEIFRDGGTISDKGSANLSDDGGTHTTAGYIYHSDGKSVTLPYEEKGVSTPSPKSTSVSLIEIHLQKYCGKFTQEYPPYSSKTVNGIQLHSLSRSGDLPDEIPSREVEIYSIEELGRRVIDAATLKEEILKKITLVKGDFRQKEIIKKWHEVLNDSDRQLSLFKIRVNCSSGTYMRSLAHRMGKDVGVGAFALAIKRTKIGNLS